MKFISLVLIIFASNMVNTILLTNKHDKKVKEYTDKVVLLEKEIESKSIEIKSLKVI